MNKSHQLYTGDWAFIMVNMTNILIATVKFSSFPSFNKTVFSLASVGLRP